MGVNEQLEYKKYPNLRYFFKVKAMVKSEKV